jgi:iron complex transport system substrate-binding protein
MARIKGRAKGQFYTSALILIALVLVSCTRAEATKRIVSLYSGHTDNIVALGCKDALIAVSTNDDAKQFKGIDRLPIKVGAERILALRPDLVLIRSLVEKQNPSLRNVLEKAGVKVRSIDPPVWENFGSYLKELAEICGADPSTAELKLKKAVADISAESEKRGKGKKKPVVFIEATARELHTCAPDSWAAHLIALAGGINAARSAKPLRKGSALAPWGLERVLENASAGLDVYIVQSGAMNGTTLDDLKRRNWFKALGGVKAAVVPEAFLSRPSLLGIEQGGRMLLEIFNSL